MTAPTVERKYGEMSVGDLQARAEELRGDLTELTEGERSDEYGTRMRALVDEVNALDTHLTLALAKEQKSERALIPGPIAATAFVGIGEGFRSGGELLMDHEAMTAWVGSGMRGAESFEYLIECGINAFHLPMSGVRDMTEFGTGGPGTNASTGVNALLPVGQPIPPAPRQAKLYLRDLIPVQPTTLTQVPYVRELNPTTTESGVTAVAELGLKPDTTDSFDPEVAYVTVIAGNVSPSKQLWEDAPLVAAYINQRLPYKVKFQEDHQFLNGPGGYPNITGIRNMSGVQSQAATSGEYAITIGNALAKIELVDGQGTAVVMYPTDAWAMFTKRAAGGSGTFDAGTPFSNLPLTVWGLPTYRTRAATQGEALVADFARGFMVLDREQVNVQVYPQHKDYAARNQILVQAEERVGLMGPRPDLAVKAALS